MRCKWTEIFDPVGYEEMIFDGEAQTFEYEGEIIGTERSFWGDTYLVVACDDNKVRTIEISKVKKI